MEQLTVAERLAAVRAASAALVGFDGVVHQAGSDELGPMLGELASAVSRLQAAQVSVLGDALQRGVVAGSGCRVTVGVGDRVGAVLRRWRCRAAGGGDPADRPGAQPAAAGRSAGGAGAGAQRGGGAGRDGQAPHEADRGRRTTRCWRGSSPSPPGTGRGRSGRCGRRSSPNTAGRTSSSAARTGSSTAPPCPSRTTTTGSREYRLRLDPEGSAVLEAILGPLAAPQPSDRARVGHQDQRPAPGRRAGRGLPPRRRRGRGRAGHGEGGGVRDDGLPGPGRAHRGRDHADRGAARPRDGPADGLRRGHHPGRPRLEG